MPSEEKGIPQYHVKDKGDGSLEVTITDGKRILRFTNVIVTPTIEDEVQEEKDGN